MSSRRLAAEPAGKSGPMSWPAGVTVLSGLDPWQQRVAGAAACTVPGLLIRLTGGVVPYPVQFVAYGAAVVAAAFMLAWACEAAQVDIGHGARGGSGGIRRDPARVRGRGPLRLQRPCGVRDGEPDRRQPPAARLRRRTARRAGVAARALAAHAPGEARAGAATASGAWHSRNGGRLGAAAGDAGAAHAARCRGPDLPVRLLSAPGGRRRRRAAGDDRRRKQPGRAAQRTAPAVGRRPAVVLGHGHPSDGGAVQPGGARHRCAGRHQPLSPPAMARAGRDRDA